MADVKKDQERDELFRRIYKIATDLVHAGHVAEWDFKSNADLFQSNEKGAQPVLTCI